MSRPRTRSASAAAISGSCCDPPAKQARPLPEEELQCPICSELFVECVSLSACGHCFCLDCCNRALKHKSSCPMCRKAFTGMHRVTLIDALIRASFPDRGSIRSAFAMKMETTRKELQRWGILGIFDFEPTSIQQMASLLGFSHNEFEACVVCRNTVTNICDTCNNPIEPVIEYLFSFRHAGTMNGEIIRRRHTKCDNSVFDVDQTSATENGRKLFCDTFPLRTGFQIHPNSLGSAHCITGDGGSCAFGACTRVDLEPGDICAMVVGSDGGYLYASAMAKSVHLECLDEYIQCGGWYEFEPGLVSQAKREVAAAASSAVAVAAEEPVSIPESPADSDSEPAILPREPDLDLEAEHEPDFEPPEPLEFTFDGHTLTRVNPDLAYILWRNGYSITCSQCRNPILGSSQTSVFVFYRDARKSWHKFCEPVHWNCLEPTLNNARLRINS